MEKTDEANEQLTEKAAMKVETKGGDDDEEEEEVLPRKLVILRYIRTVACIGAWISMVSARACECALYNNVARGGGGGGGGCGWIMPTYK